MGQLIPLRKFIFCDDAVKEFNKLSKQHQEKLLVVAFRLEAGKTRPKDRTKIVGTSDLFELRSTAAARVQLRIIYLEARVNLVALVVFIKKDQKIRPELIRRAEGRAKYYRRP